MGVVVVAGLPKAVNMTAIEVFSRKYSCLISYSLRCSLLLRVSSSWRPLHFRIATSTSIISIPRTETISASSSANLPNTRQRTLRKYSWTKKLWKILAYIQSCNHLGCCTHLGCLVFSGSAARSGCRGLSSVVLEDDDDDNDVDDDGNDQMKKASIDTALGKGLRLSVVKRQPEWAE